MTVSVILHSCNQRNLHFAGKAKTPGIPTIREICISCFDAAIASTIIYIFSSKSYHATRKNAIPAMRIGMSFSPTIVTNFVGLVFCAFVQDFNCSENAFLEKFRQTAYRYAASKQRNADFVDYSYAE